MLISDLQDRLRTLVRERIEAGEWTGTELAKLAGFQQAHISNFLNRRRGLSIEAMDRMMEVLRLEVWNLMPEASRKALPRIGDESEFDSVPMVRWGALWQSEFDSGEIIEYQSFKKSFLRRIRPELAKQRRSWRRFVLIKADKASGAAMRPKLQAGATLLIDRHYNSARRYRRGEPNLFVVKSGNRFLVRHVEAQGDQLMLRPENQKCALGCIRLSKGENVANYVVGRVAHISIET